MPAGVRPGRGLWPGAGTSGRGRCRRRGVQAPTRRAPWMVSVASLMAVSTSCHRWSCTWVADHDLPDQVVGQRDRSLMPNY